MICFRVSSLTVIYYDVDFHIYNKHLVNVFLIIIINFEEWIIIKELYVVKIEKKSIFFNFWNVHIFKYILGKFEANPINFFGNKT